MESSGQGLTKKKGITARRSSKNKHMENISCQVCGDVAAGFYCGAYICEACKVRIVEFKSGFVKWTRLALSLEAFSVCFRVIRM